MEGRIVSHWQAHLKVLPVALLVYAPFIMGEIMLIDRVGHFVAPEKTRAWIAEKKMAFFPIEGCASRKR